MLQLPQQHIMIMISFHNSERILVNWVLFYFELSEIVTEENGTSLYGKCESKLNTVPNIALKVINWLIQSSKMKSRKREIGSYHRINGWSLQFFFHSVQFGESLFMIRVSIHCKSIDEYIKMILCMYCSRINHDFKICIISYQVYL